MQPPDETAIRLQMLNQGQPAMDFAADLDEKLDTQAMAAKYDVLEYRAPFVVVQRKSDGVLGTLEFTHHPRWYFAWKPHESGS